MQLRLAIKNPIGLLFPTPIAPLSAEERHFLDHDVKRLCELVDDWQTQQDRDLPPAAWDFMKSGASSA